METSFWFMVSGWSTALSYTPTTSLQLLGWKQNSPCVMSFFFSPAKTHTTALFSFCKHGESKFASLAAIQVSLQCSLVMDSSSLEKDCVLTTFREQMCLTKRCTCNIRVQIFYFTTSVLLSWQMQNSSKIKTYFKFLAIFRSTKDFFLLS